MAGRGPAPKPQSQRQKRGKPSTAAKLVDTSRRSLKPKLPARVDGEPWHPQTLAFWRVVWKSPMASEYVEADVPGLVRLAVLVDEFWRGSSDVVKLSAEIRLVGQNYGLSPLDRRRLQWEINRVKDEKPKPNASSKGKRKDPRIGLGELRSLK